MAVPQSALNTHTSSHDLMARKNKLTPPEGNIVQTYVINGTTIHICDDYVARTPEAIEKVKKDMYAKAWAIVLRLRSDGVSI